MRRGISGKRGKGEGRRRVLVWIRRRSTEEFDRRMEGGTHVAVPLSPSVAPLSPLSSMFERRCGTVLCSTAAARERSLRASRRLRANDGRAARPGALALPYRLCAIPQPTEADQRRRFGGGSWSCAMAMAAGTRRRSVRRTGARGRMACRGRRRAAVPAAGAALSAPVSELRRVKRLAMAVGLQLPIAVQLPRHDVSPTALLQRCHWRPGSCFSFHCAALAAVCLWSGALGVLGPPAV